MSTTQRRTRDKVELRQEILDAARELFAKDGYESVSMRKIAEKIDYSQTTIYLYFENKADLLGSICEETFAKLDELLRSIESEDRAPLDLLRAGMKAYVEFGLAHPNDYQVTFMMRAPVDAQKPADHRASNMGMRTFDDMRRLVSRCIATGALVACDPDETSQALWAGIHGVTSLLITKCGFPFVEKNRLIDAVIHALLNGICAR